MAERISHPCLSFISLLLRNRLKTLENDEDKESCEKADTCQYTPNNCQ